MLAVCVAFGGGAAGLRVAAAPMPQPKAEELLVKVRAAALNPADLLQRDGLWPAPPGASEILGVEIAGDVVRPDAAGRFAIGTPVFGLLAGGGYATHAVLDAGLAAAIPDGLSYEEAAAIPEAALVGQSTLFDLGALVPGETVLLHGASGGMGSMAVQMAHQAGARVVAIVGSDAKAARVSALGADVTLLRRPGHRFADAVSAALGGRGVDVIVDVAGADTLLQNLELLVDQGRLVQLGIIGGAMAEIDLDCILLKRLRVMGTIMRPLPLADKRHLFERFARRWLPEFAAGRLKPVIDSVFAWGDVARAHEHLAQGKHVGKIVLDIDRAKAVVGSRPAPAAKEEAQCPVAF
jgi:NADPH:quinone reductase